MAQTAHEAEQIVKEYTALWNEQNFDQITDVVSESFTHVSPAVPDGEVSGPDGVEAFMREVTTGFPDFEVTIVDILSRDDQVMVENEFTMTHSGEFDGIPPTGKEIELRSMANCRVADGQLEELRESIDMLDVFVQLGVVDERALDAQ